MKKFCRRLLLFCAVLFLNPLISTEKNVCIKGVCKKVFSDSSCSYQDKVCCVNKALEDEKLLIKDKELLTCLQIILHTFVTPKTPIDPNVILYRTPKETILHWASKFDELELMEQLIAQGAKINPRNQWKETPLHYAALWNSPKAAQLLIKSGADMSAQDQYKKTPLDYAKEYKNNEVLAVLIKQTKKEEKPSK